MIVSICGNIGSGKSTVAKLLARKLGYKSYYIGRIRREMARKRGMSLAEFNCLGERDPLTDKEPDEYQKQLGEKEDNFVIEGRTSFFFIPKSVKIYIHVDPEIGAERVWKDLQKNPKKRNEGSIHSLEDMKRFMKERMASDQERYRKYYGIENAFDKKHFDFVVDSTHISAKEVTERILEFVQKEGK